MRALENCKPERVFYYFEEICKIPHGSGNTRQISDYLVQFAKDHHFEYVQDDSEQCCNLQTGHTRLRKCPCCDPSGTYGYGLREKT